jgi:lipopolysaccharide export LptBFGC system permease protein LptF
VFVLVLAVPALLVVVLGYVVGHALWTAVGGPAPEVVGWVIGVVLLAVVTWALLRMRRHRALR